MKTKIDLTAALSHLANGITILESVRDSNHNIVDFKWVYTNKAADIIHGESFEAVQQTTLFNKVPILQSYLPKLIDVVESGKVLEHEVYDNRIKKWLHGSYKKYNDGFIASLQDVSEKKLSEKKLKESENLSAKLFENNGIGIGMIDRNGRYLMVNSKLAKMLGRNKEDFPGTSIDRYYFEKESPKSKLFSGLLKGEFDTYEVENKFVRRDGTVFWALSTVSLFAEQHENVFAISLFQDIDVRKKAEDELTKVYNQLQRLNADKDRLLSILAHDLRDPVSSLAQFVWYLLDSFDEISKSEFSAHLHLLKTKSSALCDLLEELLLWTQNQLNHLNLAPEKVAVIEALNEIIDKISDRAKEKNITIKFNYNQGRCVMVNKNMFNAIVRNLLTNAIKFSPERSVVVIDCKATATDILVSVTDQGIGMSDELVKKIMNKEQVQSQYGTKGEKGIGIGLSLIMDFIEKCGSKIKIKSVPDKGSTFSFFLPVCE